MAGLFGSIGVGSAPNFWDQSGEARQNMLKGLEGVRNYRGALGDNGAMAQDYATAGNAAMTQAMDMYGAQAMGTGPSLAGATMQQGLEANNRAAMGLMGQARGGNVAGAYQQALGAQSGANMQTAQQGAINAMAEQQAGLQGYAGLAGQSAQLGQGYSQLASQHQLAADQNDLGWYAAKRGMDIQKQQGDRDFFGGLIQSGIGAAGSAAGAVSQMSDERAKFGMQPASVADATAEVGGLGYEYQPGLGQPQGQQYGVSAQQLAQTSLGPTLVAPGPDGLLRVDGGRAGITALAGTGENTRRIQQLEQRLAMSQGGTPEQMYGTAEQGAARTQDAAQRSNEIAMQRGLGQVERARGGPAYDFGVVPASMQRGGGQAMPVGRDPYAIDPFEGDAPPPHSPQGLVPRSMPRRRRAPGLVQSNPPSVAMRGQAVANRGNEERLLAPAPYYQGDADLMPIPTANDPGEIPYEWQEAVDSINDYNDEWISRDELTGKPVFTGRRIDLSNAMPRGQMRAIEDVERMDMQALVDAEKARLRALPNAGRV